MENKIIKYEFCEDVVENVMLHVDAYPNGSLALLFMNTYGEPFADITVFIHSFGIKNMAAVDTNNNPNAEKFIIDNLLGMKVGEVHSGFCTYPVYVFDMDKLNEFDPEGVEVFNSISFDMYA